MKGKMRIISFLLLCSELLVEDGIKSSARLTGGLSKMLINLFCNNEFFSSYQKCYLSEIQDSSVNP